MSNTKHPYAEILTAIANGEQIQWVTCEGVWRSEPDTQVVLSEILHKVSSPERYRIKPKTIRIGEFDVPEPICSGFIEDHKYYFPNVTEGETDNFRWDSAVYPTVLIGGGLLHETQEAAQIHLDALLSFTRKV